MNEQEEIRKPGAIARLVVISVVVEILFCIGLLIVRHAHQVAP